MKRLMAFALPLAGILAVIGLWALTSAFLVDSLPSPARTWAASKAYILDPFAKRTDVP